MTWLIGRMRVMISKSLWQAIHWLITRTSGFVTWLALLLYHIVVCHVLVHHSVTVTGNVPPLQCTECYCMK